MPLSSTHLPDKFLTLAEMMNISEQEPEKRKKFLQFGSEEEERLRRLASHAEDYAEEVIESFYEHLLSIDEMKVPILKQGDYLIIAMLKAADNEDGFGNHGR